MSKGLRVQELRIKIEDIIVDTTLHPVDQSLRIEALITQATEQAELRGRLDEIASIPQEYGHWTTCTYINGSPISIKQRHEDLKAKLEQESIKEGR